MSLPRIVKNLVIAGAAGFGAASATEQIVTEDKAARTIVGIAAAEGARRSLSSLSKDSAVLRTLSSLTSGGSDQVLACAESLTKLRAEEEALRERIKELSVLENEVCRPNDIARRDMQDIITSLGSETFFLSVLNTEDVYSGQSYVSHDYPSNQFGFYDLSGLSNFKRADGGRLSSLLLNLARTDQPPAEAMDNFFKGLAQKPENGKSLLEKLPDLYRTGLSEFRTISLIESLATKYLAEK